MHRVRSSIGRYLATAFALGIAMLPYGCREHRSDRVVLRLANWGGAGDNDEYAKKVQDLYAEFERRNPDIEIRVENIPNEYVSKMILSFIAKAEPDVMVLDFSSAAVFINNDVLTDLTPIIETDKDFAVSDYFPNALNAARRGKSLYAIPNDFTPMVLYYNKRLFDRAGVPYPKRGWSFDDFLQTARKLTNRSSEPPTYGFVFNNWMAGWIMWLWNNDGDVLSPDGKTASGYFDSSKNISTVEFLRDLIEKYQVSPTLSATASLGVDPFANGQAAMAVSGHWSLVTYANAPKGKDGKPKITWADLGVVELPHNTSQSNTVVYETGYAIGKNSRHKEAAWKLVKFLTSYYAQHIYNASGIAVCARKDVAEERAKMPLEAQFMPIIASARPPWGSKVEGYEFVEATGLAMMDNILQNHTPVQQAMQKAAQKIDFEFSKK